MAAVLDFPPHRRAGAYLGTSSPGMSAPPSASLAGAGGQLTPAPPDSGVWGGGGGGGPPLPPGGQDLVQYIASVSPPRDAVQAAEYRSIAQAVMSTQLLSGVVPASPPAAAAHLLRILTKEEVAACHVARVRTAARRASADVVAPQGPGTPANEAADDTAPSDSETLPSIYPWERATDAFLDRSISERLVREAVE
eukprot:TRINITY_DN8392_c4_g1_i1.p1 TRINITY_DN8392_c4_g1~~TRINITY_DN8392_c4_g1_i1.p1  ORF type:complete len:216 (+),score=53.65 TRINITY_DN8392_c4_g1_i1:64-648(+)